MKKYGHGWYNESQRHALASKGIKTGRKTGDLGMVLGKSINSMNDIDNIQYSKAHKESLFNKLKDSLRVHIDKIRDKHPDIGNELSKDVHKINNLQSFKIWFKEHKDILRVVGYANFMAVSMIAMRLSDNPFISVPIALAGLVSSYKALESMGRLDK